MVVGTGSTRGSAVSPRGRYEFIPPSQGDITNPSNSPAAFTGLTSTQCPARNFGGAGNPEYLPFCDLTVNQGTNGSQPSDFRPFLPTDKYNYVPPDSLQNPIERTNIYMQAHYNFSPSVKFHTSVLYNNRNAETTAAPAFENTPPGTLIPANQKYNPFGFELSADEPVQVAPGVSIPNLSTIAKLWPANPPRVYKDDVITTQLEAGLSGNFNIADRVFNWGVDYSYASNKLNYSLTDHRYANRFLRAIGGPPKCTAQCVPLNFFGGPGAITPAMFNYVRFTQHSSTNTNLRIATVNLNSSDIFDLPYGPLGVAIGYVRRESSGEYIPDEAAAAGNITNVRQPVLPTNGIIDVNSTYAELNIPILAGLPGAHELSVDAATRYSNYNLFGSTDTNRVGVKWMPTADLAIRGTWSQGFRAPNINEAFGGKGFNGTDTNDPCSNYTQSGVSSAVQKRCKAAGVPSAYVQSNQQVQSSTGGNENLKPETSISRTIGFVYSPGFVPGFSVNADYYQIDLESTIQPFGVQNVINSCFLADDQSYCGRITRHPLGVIENINNTETNIGGTRTSGIDFGGKYKIPSTLFGDFTAYLRSSYVNSYKQFFPTGKGGRTVTQLVGKERAGANIPLSVPRWKANAGVNWNYGNFSANIIGHFISGLQEKCSDLYDNTAYSLTNLGLCSNPDYRNNSLSTHHLAAVSWYDLQVSYTTPYHFTVSVGANNIFDRKPPREVRQIGDFAFDPSEYQFLIGRLVYGRITARF
jgi:iron complex outermembrane receptor protein